MPGCPESTPPSSQPPDPPPWTVARAQTALGVAAFEIQQAAKLLEEIHAGLPKPPDIDARQEGELPYDRATDILGTIECVLEDSLGPAIELLQRSSRITDAELEVEHREMLARRVEP